MAEEESAEAIAAQIAEYEALLAQAGVSMDVDDAGTATSAQMEVEADLAAAPGAESLADDTAVDAEALANEVAAVEAQIAAAALAAEAVQAAETMEAQIAAAAAVAVAAAAAAAAEPVVSEAVASTEAAPAKAAPKAKAAIVKAAPAKAGIAKSAPAKAPIAKSAPVVKATASAPAKAPKFCGECGAVFKDVSKFCSGCGAKRLVTLVAAPVSEALHRPVEESVAATLAPTESQVGASVGAGVVTRAPKPEAINSLLGGYDSDSDGNAQAHGEASTAPSLEPPPIANAAANSPAAAAPAAPAADARGTANLRPPAEFMVSPGCLVEVRGLQKAPHLNGQHGIVKQLDPGTSESRWEVELKLDCGCTEVKNIRPQNLVSANSSKRASSSEPSTSLKPGSVVVIDGLVKAAHLNGQHALAMSYDRDAERWEVEVHFPATKTEKAIREVKAIKTENLTLRQPGLQSGVVGPAGPAASSFTRPEAVGPAAPTPGSLRPEAVGPAAPVLPSAHAAASSSLRPEAVGPAVPASSSTAAVPGAATAESSRSGGAPAAAAAAGAPQTQTTSGADLKIGDHVRIHGLKSAHLNDLLATVERFSEAGATAGRWEVKIADGSIKAIKPDNLALVPQAEPGRGSAGDVDADVVMERLQKILGTATAENSGYGGAPAAATAGGPQTQATSSADLKIGDRVRIFGLKSAQLNDLLATVERFVEAGAAAGRWEVMIPDGSLKAIKPEHLALVPESDWAGDADADVVMEEEVPSESHDEDECDDLSGIRGTEIQGSGSRDFSKLDDNELAGAALQAEITGNVEEAAALNGELAKRRGGMTGCAGGDKAGSREGAYVEELIEVADEYVGHVIGVGGVKIAEIRDECVGAKLTFLNADAEKPDVKVMFARGPASVVAKARRLVEEVIAEAKQPRSRDRKGGKGKGKKGVEVHLDGGAAGTEEGICKWFAAGFCRNKPMPGTNSCRNGMHDSAAARSAEQAWVAEAPPSGSVPPPQKRPVLLLLDLEGGGNAFGTDGEDEIIECPTLAMCPATGKELGRFHRFVKPGFWERESEHMRWKHSDECFNNDSSSEPFAQVVAALIAWIGVILGVPAQSVRSEDFLFVTCGKWDVKTALPRQSNKPCPGHPASVDVATQELLFGRFCNLKEAFQKHFDLPDAKTPTGMRGMLKRLKIPLSGQHHLGMDDVTNLCKILKILVSQGGRIEQTGVANNLVGGAKAAAAAFKKGSKGQGAKGAKPGVQWREHGKDGKGKGPIKGGKDGKGSKFGKDGKGKKDGKGGGVLSSGPGAMAGICRSWNDEKKFGFIKGDEGGVDHFCHRSQLVGGIEGLNVGDRVRFDVTMDEAKGKMCATNISSEGGGVAGGGVLSSQPGTMTGICKSWNDEKKFGFIAGDAGGVDHFCHRSQLVGGIEGLNVGDRVRFDVTMDETKGKMCATNVSSEGGVFVGGGGGGGKDAKGAGFKGGHQATLVQFVQASSGGNAAFSMPPPPPPLGGPPPDFPGSLGAAASAQKRPAETPPGGTAKVARKEGWNPWAEAPEEWEVPVDQEKSELQQFLHGAPRPGEDWEQDDDGEEEEPAASKASQGQGAGLLDGVLSGGGLSPDPAPVKAASLASLFASLPKPIAGGDDLD